MRAFPHPPDTRGSLQAAESLYKGLIITENMHAAAGDVENQRAAAVAEEGRMDAGAEAGSQSHGWGTAVASFFKKRLRMSLPTSETLPEERRQSLPFRPGHNIDVIKEEPLDGGDMGGDPTRPNLDLDSRFSTGTSSSSEVKPLTYSNHSAVAECGHLSCCLM